MKVKVQPKFLPITITLETEEEAKELTGIMAQVRDTRYLEDLYRALKAGVRVPMEGLYRGELKRNG